MKDLLSSKKFRTMLVTLLASVLTSGAVALLAVFGVDDPEIKQALITFAEVLAAAIVLLGSAAVGAQGVADAGKEAEKIKQANGGGGTKAVGVFLAVALALSLQGCTLQGAYVAADAQTYEAVAPVYLRYTDADRSLGEADRDRRRRLVESWKARIDEGEAPQ